MIHYILSAKMKYSDHPTCIYCDSAINLHDTTENILRNLIFLISQPFLSFQLVINGVMISEEAIRCDHHLFLSFYCQQILIFGFGYMRYYAKSPLNLG